MFKDEDEAREWVKTLEQWYNLNRFSENVFGDETLKVIVNTKGTVGEISEELRELLVYLDEGRATGDYTRQLDNAVKSVKSSEARRHEYMVMMIREMELKEEAGAEGRA